MSGRPRLPEGDVAVEQRRKHSRASSHRARERNKPIFRGIIDAFLSNPCTDCGERYPLPAMQPDHVRGKKYKIAWFRGGNGTLKMLNDELAKCEVRCANCHCIRHAADLDTI